MDNSGGCGWNRQEAAAAGALEDDDEDVDEDDEDEDEVEEDEVDSLFGAEDDDERLSVR